MWSKGNVFLLPIISSVVYWPMDVTHKPKYNHNDTFSYIFCQYSIVFAPVEMLSIDDEVLWGNQLDRPQLQSTEHYICTKKITLTIMLMYDSSFNEKCFSPWKKPVSISGKSDRSINKDFNLFLQAWFLNFKGGLIAILHKLLNFCLPM